MEDAPVNDLLDIIYSEHFDDDFFKSTIKHANEFKHTMQRNQVKIMIEKRFQKGTFPKHARPLPGLPVHYNRDVIKGLQEYVSLA